MSTRLVPSLPLPPYGFVPGQSPHPLSHPLGHSFGQERLLPPPIDPSHWQKSEAYLYAIDLFNAGFYWECHEALEGLWIVHGRRGIVADYLKGLIHFAAAGVKHLEGVPRGVTGHNRRAAELWREVARATPPDEVYLGFRLDTLIALAESIAEDGWPTTPPLLRVEDRLSRGGTS